MPTGLPDLCFPAHTETTAERLIREAMEAGNFDELPGTGAPIPGVGTADDELWWIRSWLERNREPDSQGPSRAS